MAEPEAVICLRVIVPLLLWYERTWGQYSSATRREMTRVGSSVGAVPSTPGFRSPLPPSSSECSPRSSGPSSKRVTGNGRHAILDVVSGRQWVEERLGRLTAGPHAGMFVQVEAGPRGGFHIWLLPTHPGDGP